MVAIATPELPEIFDHACDDGPPFDRPWRADPWVFATDGRLLVRALELDLPFRATRGLPCGHPANVAAALDLFKRWRPDGRVLILPVGHDVSVPCPRCRPGGAADCPTCGGSGWVLDRRRVRLAPGIDIAAYWVATLVDLGVREVEAGVPDERGFAAPLRFRQGVVEGLLMPMREVAR